MKENLNIVVAGASRGIGKEIVLQLAKNSSHNIFALSRNLEKMEQNFGQLNNVKSFSFDLSKKDVRSQANMIFKNLESIDILINNAGKLVNKPFLELSGDDLDSCYQVNAIGVMQTVQAAVPKMTSAHIINISTIGGFQGSVKFPGLMAYSTSKAAIVSFTELFSEEYKDTDIKMNCLCLGAAQTEMLEEAFPGYEAPVSASKMAEYIVNFSLNGNEWMNGKVIPVSLSTP